MPIQLDFSTTGVMSVTGDRVFNVHLRNVTVYAPRDVETTPEFGRADIHEVIIRDNIDKAAHRFDIRDINTPSYATTQDLVDDINDAIAAMYAGGGGGGGIVNSVGVATANGVSGSSSGGATPVLTIQAAGLTTNKLKVAHGFAAGDAIGVTVSTGVHVLYDVNDEDQEFAGFVWSATDDTFRLITSGDTVGASPALFSGLTAGPYYADPSTPGGITATRPTGSNVVQFLLQAHSATAGYVERGAKFVGGVTSGVLTYKATLTQAGTSAPVASVLVDTIVPDGWTYFDVGDYRLPGAGKFLEGKTWSMVNAYLDGDDNPLVADLDRLDDDTMILQLRAASDGTTPVNLNNGSRLKVVIETYP